MHLDDDTGLAKDTSRRMGIGVQVILGFFLVVTFCALAWWMFHGGWPTTY